MDAPQTEQGANLRSAMTNIVCDPQRLYDQTAVILNWILAVEDRRPM